MGESSGIEHFPLLAKEGWPRYKRNGPVPKRRGRGWSITSHVPKCVLKHAVWLTTIYVSRCRAHAARPSAALRWLRDFLLMPQPPLLGKEGKIRSTELFSAWK